MPEDIRQLTYAGAVNAALRRVLTELPETLVFGEDVALPGGVYGTTKGLRKDFGERVFDTPISEAAILGTATGAAMLGMRPIPEIMFNDFMLVALDQVINQMANIRYISLGQKSASITIRTQQGAGPGSCAQHSQNLEVFYSHIPGLRVCMPVSVQDAYDLTVAAVYCDDPVIVIEDRTLYHLDKAPLVLGGSPQVPSGAEVVRVGSALTIVSWGRMLVRVAEAADRLAAEGIEVEVIDLRWIRPLDLPTILDSVGRTGRLVVAHDAHVVSGLGAEILASVSERGLDLLAPPVRIGAPDTRVPAAPSLLAAYMPSADRIVDECRTLLGTVREPNSVSA
jgi:pyruvate/2-oxoglutarate/acetoin dehydrogenase E1 component